MGRYAGSRLASLALAPIPPRAMAQEDASVAIDLGFAEAGGYTRLAEFMGQQPQLAIFRRFAALTNANLLYLQAEITQLEDRLDVVQTQDSQSSDDARQKYLRSWNQLSMSAGFDAGSPEREQYELIMRLRELIVQYRTSCSLSSLALSIPCRSDRCSLAEAEFLTTAV